MVNIRGGFSGGARQLSSKVAEVKQLNPDEVDGYFIFEKANEGDEEVLAILDEFTKQIAAQIVNLQCVIDHSVWPLVGELVLNHYC